MHKKITHILYSGLGGHGSVVFSYLQKTFLDQTDNHLLFFGIEDLNPDYVEKCDEISASYSFIKKESGFKFSYIKDFIRVLKSQKSDLIITHSLPTIPLILLYQLFNRTKVVLVEHASIDVKRKSDYIWTILGLLFCAKIVYLTQVEYDEAKNKFGYFFNSSKTSVIPNGIDLKKFTPKPKLSENKITIVKHCRLSESKDLETLINGFALFRQMLVVQKAELKIAGNGQVLDKLQRLAKKLDLENELHFLGLLKEDEIIKLLNNADIYVNSSKAETLSTSIIQSMACGVACVVSDIIENKMLIEDKTTGRLFKVSDPKDLAQVLYELSQDSAQRKRLGLNARDYAEIHFSNDLMVERYQHLVAELS